MYRRCLVLLIALFLIFTAGTCAAERFRYPEAEHGKGELNQGAATLQTMVFEPAALRLHLAFGKGPATRLPLHTLALAELFHDRQKAAQAEPPKVQRDIEYARAGEHSLQLDLYMPPTADKPPLIVWVHGGAWRSGSKSSMPLNALIARGYAVASVDYRLSPVAPFPAQCHDLKAAIRYLRAKSGEFGLDSRRFVIAGASAGAHLAALVGVSNGDKNLEGMVGDHLGTSSDVQAIVSFYGMSNLTSILSQSTPHGLKLRVPALQLLLGGEPEEKAELAKQASPVFHVDAKDPPLLLLHGDQDAQAPINQSHELQGAYEKLGRPVQFVVVYGAAHGGDSFFDEQRIKIVADFLDRSLK